LLVDSLYVIITYCVSASSMLIQVVYVLHIKVKVKQMIYIAVLCNSKITAELLYNTPLVHWTLCRCQQYGAFSMKALARYQVILLGEQRHIRCEQLAQGCCPNNAAVGVEPATS